MDDSKIIDSFFARSDEAIKALDKKYSRYCHSIAFNILHSNEDAEECVNDAYLKVWNSVPPLKPSNLSAYLGKIVRNLSIHKYKSYTAEKRGGGQAQAALAELEECISLTDVESEAENAELAQSINNFLKSIPQTQRIVFVKRYWFLCPIKTIASECSMSESKVTSMLYRIREKLKKHLESEGIYL